MRAALVKSGSFSRHRDADVIIAGAGPAGSVTALLLARAGHDVLLLDRHPFPRTKPCGDCISAGAVPLLERLGLLPAVLALPHAVLTRWRITGPTGEAFEADIGTAALSVERAALDHALLRAAIAAGARFRPHARVSDLLRDPDGRVTGVLAREEPLRAPLIIGADGLRSVIASRLGAVARPPRLRKASLTFHVDGWPRDSDVGEMHSGDGICAGIAPVDPGGRTNITVVADAARYGSRLRQDAVAFAAGILAELPGTAARTTSHTHHMLRAAGAAASGPFDRPVRAVVYDGAALVGDAAGYYDPFTGQGVFQALAAAELLAPVAAEALRTGDTSARALAPYARQRRRMMRGPRMLQHIIEAVLARPAVAAAAIARIAAAPAFGRAIVRATGDVEHVSTLLSPGPLSSLLFPPPLTEQK